MSNLIKCLKCVAEHPREHYRRSCSVSKVFKWCARCRKENGKSTNAGRDYESRNEELKRLGFANYHEYLDSELWKSIRRRVYALKGSKCHLCPNQATELHHNRYHKNDLLGEKLDYIQPICRACHERIEFRFEKGRKRKVSLKEASTKFKKMKKSGGRRDYVPGRITITRVIDPSAPSPYGR